MTPAPATEPAPATAHGVRALIREEILRFLHLENADNTGGGTGDGSGDAGANAGDSGGDAGAGGGDFGGVDSGGGFGAGGGDFGGGGGDTGGDTMNANGGLTINPDGTVNLTLSGHLIASGVELPEQAAGSGAWPPAIGTPTSIVWKNAGTIEEFIEGTDTGAGAHRLSLLAGAAGAVRAGLDINGGAGGSVIARAGTTASKRVLDSNGVSDFLKLAVPPFNIPVAVDFGILTLTWTGSNLSGGVTINHNLGRVPAVVIASAVGAPAAGEIPACNTFSYTSTQFIANGDTRVSWTGTCNVAWVAIG